jgi:hypothetical protein
VVLTAWNAAKVENGFASRPQLAASVVQAGASFLTNQIMSLTVTVTSPVAVPPGLVSR